MGGHLDARGLKRCTVDLGRTRRLPINQAAGIRALQSKDSISSVWEKVAGIKRVSKAGVVMQASSQPRLRYDEDAGVMEK